jgi:bisphosphoglycerate-dependent phosphoglycerate mutase
MKTLLKIIIPIIATSLSFANDARVEELLKLSNKIKLTGPNCVSSSLYAAGLVDDYSYISTSSLAALFASSSCHEVKAEKRAKNDLVIAYGEDHKYQGLVPHVAYLTSSDTAFAKKGYESTKAAAQIVNEKLINNPGNHISKDSGCQSTLTSSAKTEDCFYEASAARYFRCNFSELRTKLFTSSSYQKLQVLRASILKASATERDNIKKSLEEISKSLIDRQKKDFPLETIEDDNKPGSINLFLVGFRVEKYLYDDIIELSEEFKNILIEASIITSLETQLEFLKKP